MTNLKNIYLVVLLAFAQFVMQSGLAIAQEKRWKEVNSVRNLPDGLWPLKAFQYQSEGLLPGEFVTATIVEDRRHLEKTGKTDYAIVLQTVIDIDQTFPDDSIVQLLDWGFCSLVNDECEKYIWITETLMTALSTEANKFTWRGSFLSLTAQCYSDMDSARNGTNPDGCYKNLKAMSSTGITYLDDFTARWKSENPSPRRLSMRFYTREKEYRYVWFVADDLYEHAVNFANSR